MDQKNRGTRDLVRRGEIYFVPFTMLRLDPDNERDPPSTDEKGEINDEKFLELIESIQEHGVKECLSAYKGSDPADGQEVYFVDNGSRRFRAMEIIYEKTGEDIIAPIRPFQKNRVSEEQRIIDRILRNEGVQFTRLEKAKSVQKLANKNWSDQTIAEKLKVSVTWVRETLFLAASPEELKQLIRNGTISASEAVNLLKENTVSAFLNDFAAGRFNIPKEKFVDQQLPFAEVAQETPAASQETNPTKNHPAVLTGKDLSAYKPTNSFKVFRKFAKTFVNSERIKPEAKPIFDFMQKLLANELGDIDMATFFLQDIDEEMGEE